jgi:hypothetical protein
VILRQLYHAIQKVSGCEYIVDSSKVASYGLLVNMLPDVDLHVIHLVRDSRAVAYSLRRLKARPEIYWESAYMDVRGPTYASVAWLLSNWFAHSLKSRVPHYLFLRYEDLVVDPIPFLLRVTKYLGASDPNLSFLRNDRFASLSFTHSISGNPDRFKQGLIEIRPDVEWKTKMWRIDKYLVTTLTWPLLLRYGYVA